jgi:hypothetical protein
MNQYSIFSEINRCCMCGCSIDKGQLCEDNKCADEWWKKYIINGIKQ